MKLCVYKDNLQLLVHTASVKVVAKQLTSITAHSTISIGVRALNDADCVV